jgi:hypothetical protein
LLDRRRDPLCTLEIGLATVTPRDARFEPQPRKADETGLAAF